ncbi:helix-turn-helix domain-containing protein [Acidiphilium multivorum]|uniref:MerR family transcriptional regulator n=1 Tax=Acidiphilium multivorum TaxID=62140 RepID=UPI002015F6D2|nr:helix-turn-helix domain-containing protein [Acidiphilium multivorum]MBS3025022.1 helix-turn-helix domain-containing protein [Acidiphilium multivorum]
MTSKILNIGDLAKETKTKTATIRYYERIGLLSAPARTSGNYRTYTRADVMRLSFIRRARALGFSVGQIRTLIELNLHKDQSCEQVDAIAREHLAEVDRKLAGLTALRAELFTLLEQCSLRSIGECRIIEALALSA